MALVKINIPGVGEVTAENAASEDTLLRLVDAIEKQTAMASKKSGGGKNPNETKETKDLIDAKKKETKAVDESIKSTKGASKGADDYNKAQKKSSESLASLKNAWEGMKPGLGQAGGALIDFGASVGKTAISVAAAFAKTYDDMAKNPIGTAATLMNTGIDLMGSAAKTAADVATGVAKSGAGLLGPFSGVVTGAADGLNALAKAAIDLAVTLAKAANDIMAKEFEKSVAALKSYTAQGASFAGGMTEMRLTAKGAGLTIDALAQTAKMASSDLRAMGLSQGEGVKKLAKGMEAATRVIGKSGGSLRDEMLGLGYSYEEQGAVMAQYMSQQKTAGALDKMTSEQIAKGTADYAKNLKVITDLTGQDAKKLMEKAQAESARGALMGKLNSEQQKAFKDAHVTLMQLGPEAGPKLQAALTQMLAGGTVTDPIIAQNEQAMALIRKTAEGVKSGSQDMIKQTARANGEFVVATKKYGETATSFASTMSTETSGLVRGVGGFNDSVRGLNIDPKTGELAVAAAEKQATATDDLTKSYQQITKDANAAAMVMEDLATANLGLYAKMLSKTYQESVEMFTKGVDAMKKMIAGILGKDVEEDKGPKALTKAKGSTGEEVTYDEMGNIISSIGGTDSKAKAKPAVAAPAKPATTAAPAAAPAVPVKNSAEKKEEETFMTSFRKWFTGEGYARGGIASGPAKGYPALLHGTEAVIPLGDGKKVPLDITGLKENLNSINTASLMSGNDTKKQMASIAAMRSTLPDRPTLADDRANDTTAIMNEHFTRLSELFTKDKDEAKQQKPSAVKSDGNEQLLKEIKELMTSQLAKHDEMIDKLGETVDINQRLLTNSYS